MLTTLLLLAPGAATAGGDASWTVAADLGRTTKSLDRGFTEFDVYRLALRREFGKNLWTGESARLSGYWEGSVNYWDADDGDLFAAAFSPVFALYFGAPGDRWQPYVEAGIGVALLSETRLAGRDFSTNFQFENRLGTGVKVEPWDFHVRYMHYSNGSIKQPNNGMDSFVIGAAYRF